MKINVNTIPVLPAGHLQLLLEEPSVASSFSFKVHVGRKVLPFTCTASVPITYADRYHLGTFKVEFFTEGLAFIVRPVGITKLPSASLSCDQIDSLTESEYIHHLITEYLTPVQLSVLLQYFNETFKEVQATDKWKNRKFSVNNIDFEIANDSIMERQGINFIKKDPFVFHKN